MKKILFIAVLYFTIIIISSSNVHSDDLKALYKSDYNGFWNHWYSTKDKAISCESDEQTALFFSNALITLGVPEITEANADVIEELVVTNPRCVLRALDLIEQPNKFKFIQFILVTPLFKKYGDIEKSLMNAWEDSGFVDIKTAFYKIKIESIDIN